MPFATLRHESGAEQGQGARGKEPLAQRQCEQQRIERQHEHRGLAQELRGPNFQLGSEGTAASGIQLE